MIASACHLPLLSSARSLSLPGRTAFTPVLFACLLALALPACRSSAPVSTGDLAASPDAQSLPAESGQAVTASPGREFAFSPLYNPDEAVPGEDDPASRPTMPVSSEEGHDLPGLPDLAALTPDQLARAASLPAGAGTEPDLDFETFRELLRVGSMNNILGRYGAAERVLLLAFDICEAELGVDDPDCGDVLTRVGVEISNQGRIREAEDVMQRAERLVRQASSPLDLPRHFTYRAMSLANRGENDKAWDMILTANKQRQEIMKAPLAEAYGASAGSRDLLDRAMADLAHGLYVQGTIAFRRHELKAAKLAAHLSRVLIGRSEIAPDWWIAHPDELLARIAEAEGDMEEAEKRQSLSLRAKRLALGQTRPAALSHLWLGDVLLEEDRAEETIEESRAGLEIITREISSNIGDAIEIDRITGFLQAAWEKASATQDPEQRQQLYNEMFESAQLNQAGVAAQSISQMAARLQSRDPTVAALVREAQEAQRIRQLLRQELGREAVRLRGERDPDRFERFRRAAIEAARTARALEERLLKIYPRYASLVAPRPVSHAELAEMLAPDENVILFAIGSKSSFAFQADRYGVTPFPLQVTRAEVEQAVLDLRRAFTVTADGIAPFDMSLSRGLHRKLFGPFQDRLLPDQHLVVVPGGALLSLPPGLLISYLPPGTAPEAYSQARWLARDFAISTIPSIRAFASLRQIPSGSSPAKTLAGFANPAYQGAKGGSGMSALASHCQQTGPLPAALLRGLEPLPGTRQELQNVAAALNADRGGLFFGEQVTESLIRGLPLKDYRVIYFAAHGLLPGELQCQSEPALALTPPMTPARDRSEDGLFTASEVAGLELNADLVVLSACNTGGGDGQSLGGEALSGLARAFFYAGARSLLVSHWQVDSLATTELMSDLFRNLAEHRSGASARALRQARLDMLADPKRSHPFFWAAFTLVGDGNRQILASSPPL